MSDIEGPTAGTLALVFEQFDMSGIATLRHDVTRCAEAAGLAGEALDDFVLAINELVTNAVRHGGGRGWLRLWHDGDRLVCEVSDRGAGIVDGATNGHVKPSPYVAGGWGMWLARELSDMMTIDTGPDGTTVRISAVIPNSGPAGHRPRTNPGESTQE
ncbi:MAG TPA: ATP-binding protein [Pilimelia sp.]|nr:ATP-binding protein [Pilimelia sp.]